MLMTQNSLSPSIRARSVDLLNKHLSAGIDLRDQMRQSGWTVRRPGFAMVHELFANVSMVVENYCGRIIERTGGLGGIVHDTVQGTEGFVRVPYRLDIADEHQHIFAVSGALATFGQSAQEAIGQAKTLGDDDTAELFAEISRGIELQLWFVESHIVPKTNKKPRSRASHENRGDGSKLSRTTMRGSHRRNSVVDPEVKIARVRTANLADQDKCKL
ncbi:MAG: ferritin-like domain-containing protein [Rhizomicrobium sp.]